MFEKINIFLTTAFSEDIDSLDVVFDDVIYGKESADEIFKCIEKFSLISNKIKSLLTVSYPMSTLLDNKNLFKYIVAFKEKELPYQSQLYPLFNSVKENLFDAFKFTMENKLNNYGCLVKNTKNDEVSFYKN